ncbi:MAG: FAD-dependent oxidoreductase [Acidobacteria bacterium]|nr:FAD-dependent oxidoreductase [Acidobacteriota bacterium]
MNTYDVMIVGGGVIGGSIALELAKEKLRVAVLERSWRKKSCAWRCWSGSSRGWRHRGRQRGC